MHPILQVITGSTPILRVAILRLVNSAKRHRAPAGVRTDVGLLWLLRPRNPRHKRPTPSRAPRSRAWLAAVYVLVAAIVTLVTVAGWSLHVRDAHVAKRIRNNPREIPILWAPGLYPQPPGRLPQ